MIWTYVEGKHSVLHMQTSQSSWLTFNSDVPHFSHRSLTKAHSIHLSADLSPDDEDDDDDETCPIQSLNHPNIINSQT